MSDTDYRAATLDDILQHDFSKGPMTGCLFRDIAVPRVINGRATSFKKCKVGRCTMHVDETPARGESPIWYECSFYSNIDSTFDGVVFRKCNFNQDGTKRVWTVRSFTVKPAQMAGCTVRDMEITGLKNARLSGTRFSQCKFSGEYDDARFTQCRFWKCEFGTSRFSKCDFSRASLVEVAMSGDTVFQNCNVKKMEVTRLDLLGLKDFGGLTIKQRKEMNIRHDLADLRASFSGFMQWLHLLAILMFVSPYIWFVCAKAMDKTRLDVAIKLAPLVDILEGNEVLQSTSRGRQFVQDSVSARARLYSIPEMPLVYQLWFYALSCGETNSELRINVWGVALLQFVLVYNLARAYLLWFTKTKEHEEVVTELPSRFSFSFYPKTRTAYNFVKYAFVVNIAASFGNLIIFSLRDFPV